MANYIVNAYNNGGSGGTVNMRSGPATTYGIVVQVPHGATVSGTKSGTWSYMTYGSKSGYMMSVFLDDVGTSTPSGSWVTRWTNTPGETVNVRSGAGTNYGIVTRLSHGTKVEVNNPTATWSQIRLYGSTSILGYIMTQYLVQSAPSTSTPSGSWVTRWTNTPGETVNVRSGAGTNYGIVTRLSHGTKVEVNAPMATWSQVRLYGNTSILGYIMTEFLTQHDPNGGTGGNEGVDEGNYTIRLTVETDRFGTGTSVNFRKEASASSQKLDSITCGTPVMVTTRDGEWLPTKYNGMTGFIQAKYLAGSTEYTKWLSGVTHTVAYDRDAAVAYARQYTSNSSGTSSYNNAMYKPVGDSATNINKDCANFVSQCLFAGNMPMHDDWYYRYPGNVSNPSVNAAWKGTNSQKKAIAARKFGE